MEESQKRPSRGKGFEVDMEGLVQSTLVKTKGPSSLCSGGSRVKCPEQATTEIFLLLLWVLQGWC